MKSILIALILIVGVFSQASVDDETTQALWNAWKQQYGKQYENEFVEQYRYSIFIHNYNYIQAWNAAGNTATLALNKFADLMTEEFGALYTGTYPTPSDTIEGMIEDPTNLEVPSSWDWRTKNAVTGIKNEEQCGSCWAFAPVAAAESLYFINGNTLTDFSVQQIIDCDNKDYGCNGGWPQNAIAYFTKNGLETWAEYPFTGEDGKCAYNQTEAINTGSQGPAFVTPKNATLLKATIYQQPVAAVIEADQQVFQFYSSGVITAGCGTTVDHGVTIVGYGNYKGQDAFYVKNMWGPDWGMNGYVYIGTNNTVNAGLGVCGILTLPVYPKGVKNSTAI